MFAESFNLTSKVKKQ